MIVSSNLSQSKANSLWCHSFWWLLRSPMIGSYIGRVPNGSQIREHCAQSIQLHSVSHNIMIVSSNLSQSKANSLWCHSFWWLLRSPMIGSYIGRVPNGSQIREHCAQSIQLHSTMIKLYPLHFTRTEWPLPLRPAWPTWKQNCYTLTDSNTRQFTHDTFMIPHDTHRPRLPKTAQCFSQVPQ